MALTNATEPLLLSKIESFIRRTYKSTFVRNVAVVATGTAGAQAIAMAFAPIITRLYGPEAFGLLGTFTAIASVFTPIAALSYPIAIVLPKKDSEARGIVRLSAYIALAMATLVFLMLLIAGDRIVTLLKVQEISSFIWLIPLVILFAAWLQIKQQWLIRKKQFNITARVAVLQAFIVNSTKAGIGFFRPLAAVLILTYTLGSALHAFILSSGAKKANEDNKQKTFPRSELSLWELARTFYDFPLYRTPQVFINAISQGLPILMLASCFGPAAAGFYAIGKKLLNLPTSLIGTSVSHVLYPKLSNAVHVKAKLVPLMIKATVSLAAIGTIPFGVFILFGPPLFQFVFGKDWITAGEYARWLGLWSFFIFFTRPSVSAIPVLKLQGFFLVYEIVGTIMRATVIYLGFVIFSSDIHAIAMFCLVNISLYIFLLLLTFNTAIKCDRNNR